MKGICSAMWFVCVSSLSRDRSITVTKVEVSGSAVYTDTVGERQLTDPNSFHRRVSKKSTAASVVDFFFWNFTSVSADECGDR